MPYTITCVTTVPMILASALCSSEFNTSITLKIGINSEDNILKTATLLYLYSYLFLIDQNDIPAEKTMSIIIKSIIGFDKPITSANCL